MPREKRRKLKRRKDGRFRLKYDGQEFYSSPWAPDERECYEQKAEYQRQKLMGLSLSGGNTLFGAYARQWLPLHKKGVKRTTYGQYASLLETVLRPVRTVPLSQLTPDDITGMYNALDGKSKSYIQKAKLLVRDILDSAVAQHMIRDNPARDKTVDCPKGTAGTHRAITARERELIHQVQHSFRPMVMAMLYAGVRPEEARGIHVQRDVDFQRKIIHIREAVAFDGNKIDLGSGKNDFAGREVILLPVLEKELLPLKGYIGQCKLPAAQRGKEAGEDPEDDPGIMTQSAYDRAWESYKVHFERALNDFPPGERWWGRTKEHKAQAKQAEELRAQGKPKEARALSLPPWEKTDLRPYDFRHSFCTMCRDAGIDIKVCIKWMGHADEKMILRIYDHVTDYREQLSAETLKKIGFGQRGGGQNGGQNKVYRVKRSAVNGFRALKK